MRILCCPQIRIRVICYFFFSSRRRHTIYWRDWSSDVCSSDLRLPREVDVLELDVNQPADVRAVGEELARRWGAVDGVLHAIAFAPADALGGNFLNTPYASASTAFQVSAFSLQELTAGLLPVLENHHASVVTLDFDARVAWPVYDWMGVCKAALESVTRYLA